MKKACTKFLFSAIIAGMASAALLTGCSAPTGTNSQQDSMEPSGAVSQRRNITKESSLSAEESSADAPDDSSYVDEESGVPAADGDKINVPADGYIKVQGKKRLDGVCIYKTLKKEFRYEDTLSGYGGGGKISYHALRKGTYYLYVESDSKIKWNFVNPKSYDQQKNYCRAKATTLAKGKKKTVFFNFKYDFPRWYKITLTKKQRITLSCKFLDSGSYHYVITDSRWVDVDKDYKYNMFYYEYIDSQEKQKTRVLPKGTYYLFIERDPDDNHEGRICQISWN